MFSCPLHGWHSYEAPCPACQVTVTDSTTEVNLTPLSGEFFTKEYVNELLSKIESLEIIHEAYKFLKTDKL